MIAYFDPCIWSKTLKNKVEAQNTSVEQLHYKTFFLELIFLLKTSQRLLPNTACEGLRFNCLSYLTLLISNNIQILVIISTYDVQSTSIESDMISESTKSKKCS